LLRLDQASSRIQCEICFDDFEMDDEFNDTPVVPLPTAAELNARQRAEVEVNEYLKSKKLSIGDDPFSFWTRKHDRIHG
jgi:hypothetical protein